MKDNNTVTCSFSMDRNLYNAYKNIVTQHGENVKGNLVRYMRQVVDHEIPNAETIEALEEVKRLKADPHKKTYGSFAEIMEEL
ncbi:MAG: hypothetical protein GX911_01875 [Spirochaetales bacterium]|nr:hypothetical protein [Spirochaetales bacterium]